MSGIVGSCHMHGRPVFVRPVRANDTTSQSSTLEPVDLDGLGIQLQAFLLINEKFLHVFALIALQLNHLAHLRVIDDGAIACKLLLDHLEDLLLVKFLGQALDRGQCLATIALLDTDMDVVLGLLGLAGISIGLREGVERLKVLDARLSAH